LTEQNPVQSTAKTNADFSFFSGHCTVRKDYSPFSGHRQQIPDIPAKFRTVGNVVTKTQPQSEARQQKLIAA